MVSFSYVSYRHETHIEICSQYFIYHLQSTNIPSLWPRKGEDNFTQSGFQSKA